MGWPSEEKIEKFENPNNFPTTQNAAIAIGSRFYINGNSCKRGHKSERYTNGGCCVACSILAKKSSVTHRQRSIENQKLMQIAVSNNKTTYIPDTPCKYGHSLRFTTSNNCVICDEIGRDKYRITQRYCRIKREYGLTKIEYLAMVEKQKSCCFLCNSYHQDHFKLHVDHCHETGKVRGLLCNKCNQGIGLFNHSPELIRKAAVYCEKANNE